MPVELDDEVVVVEDAVVVGVRDQEGVVVLLRVAELGDAVTGAGKRGALLRIDVELADEGEAVAGQADHVAAGNARALEVGDHGPARRGSNPAGMSPR